MELKVQLLRVEGLNEENFKAQAEQLDLNLADLAGAFGHFAVFEE